MVKAKPDKTGLDQFKELPKQVQKVCMDLAMERYDKHYHPRNRHHKKHLWTDIILGIAVVFLVLGSAYIFLFYQNALLHQGIQLTLTPTSETVKSGDELGFNLFIENNTGESLQNSFIEFPLDTEYTVSSTEPILLRDNQVFLGTLDDNESVELTVNGFVVAETDSTIRLNAILKFDPDSFFATNEKLISESVQVMGSSLALDLDLPETLVANQPFDFSLTYENQSPVTNFEQVSLLPNWPPGWEVLESSIDLDEATDFWQVESIGSLEQGEITGRARLLATDLEEAEISVKAFASPYGNPLLQQHLELTLPVRYPNIVATMTPSSSTVSPGESAEFIVRVVNNEEFALEGVKARLKINRALFDPQSYPSTLSEGGSVELQLADRIESGATFTYPQTLTVRKQINAEIAFGNRPAELRVPAELLYDAEGQMVVLPIEPALVALNSDLSAQAFARYFSTEGDQIGRGPIPPIVGETTKYWVFVHLTNQLHPLDQINVSGRLADGVDWTGKTSVTEGANLNYNEATRFFQWQVGEMPDYKTDFEGRNFGAAFEIAITPSSEQLDQQLDLVQSIEIQGRDTVTGEILSFRVNDVTSNLIQDAYSSDDGRVTL